MPNYNNSKYLIKRLESIYNQTLLPNEIIIIDDHSTDDSVTIINNFISNKNIPVRFIINSTNTGSGYYNWIKGFELLNCDLIWIAESDDYCELNFLENLSKKFIDKSTSIAYCRTIFISDVNNNPIWTIDKYLDDNIWNSSFKKTSYELINNKFGYLNIIPNVSSCIFKKPDKYIIEIIKSYLKNGIKLVIDWMFYLLISKNSTISYINEVNNFYLVRYGSVSKEIQKSVQYLNEHYLMMSFIIENFNVEPSFIKKLYLVLEKHCSEIKIPLSILNNIYDSVKLENMIFNNKKTILIFSYGFLLGGGEMFPIYLANALYELSFNVIYMVPYMNKINYEIYNILNKNIKIVNNVKNLYNIINNFNITHINTHHQYCDSLIIEHCFKYPGKIKHVITDHGMYNIKCKETTHLLNVIKKNKSNIVYINDKNLQNFNDINVPKYKIPISIENYNNYSHIDRKELDINDDDFVITLVSRCMKEKGWEEMIDIFNTINDIHKNTKLLLIGDYRNDFGLYLKNKCLNKNILFLGFKDKVKRFFEISDIGILPTYYECESNPIVLIECLYANKPFIVSNIGDTKDMLFGKDDFAGSIIDLENGVIDKEKYILEILQYIEDKNYYNKKINEITHAIQKFSIKNVAMKYVHIFD